jgi:cysteine desulfurase
MNRPIYLDYNATTPVDPRVFAVMAPFFTQAFGNAASSAHPFGWEASQAVAQARNQLGKVLNADASGIVWTSGATEANNLAIKGVADAMRHHGRHIITQTTEHKSVLDCCKRLSRDGWEISYLQVDCAGRITPEQVREAIRPDTVLVTIMAANNETGTVQPFREIAQICRANGVLFHTDATQAIGKIPMDVQADGIDLLSMTAHKIYGPKGCGALYVLQNDPRVQVNAQMDGGGHEGGLRSGTLNVPGIVGLGAAVELAVSELPVAGARVKALRDRLQAEITRQLDNVVVNGDVEHRLNHVLNLSFGGVDGDMLIAVLDGVAVSAGSACNSHTREPSYVLRAMGVPTELAFASLRFSLGRPTSESEIDHTISTVVAGVKKLRTAKVRM